MTLLRLGHYFCTKMVSAFIFIDFSVAWIAAKIIGRFRG
jgi:hypothetical protein